MYCHRFCKNEQIQSILRTNVDTLIGLLLFGITRDDTPYWERGGCIGEGYSISFSLHPLLSNPYLLRVADEGGVEESNSSGSSSSSKSNIYSSSGPSFGGSRSMCNTGLMCAVTQSLELQVRTQMHVQTKATSQFVAFFSTKQFYVGDIMNEHSVYSSQRL